MEKYHTKLLNQRETKIFENVKKKHYSVDKSHLNLWSEFLEI